MYATNILRYAKDFVQISWIRTIIYNFFNLPFKQARHLPVLLYHPYMSIRDYFGSGGGAIRIDTERTYFGMIKLGKKSQSTCIQNRIWLYNKGTIIFNGSTLIGNGCRIDVKRGATLNIGLNTGITGDTTINCHQTIYLGKFFSCSWNVSISDTDFHECYKIERNGQKDKTPVTGIVKIGDYVWACQNVTILKGTVIPDWCVLASNSLVKGVFNVDKYTLLAGIPAKETKSRIQRVDLAALSDKSTFNITKGIKVFG